MAPIGLPFGRLANFINGELWGRPWDGAWAMVFPRDAAQVPRHPSQLYEAGLEGLTLFLIVYAVWRIEAVRKRPGLAFGLFLAGYGLARSTVEFFREPDNFLGFVALDWVTMGQVLSLPMLLVGLGLALWAARRRPA